MTKPRILIVEDNKNNVIRLRFLLEALDYEVVGTAATGEDAITTAQNTAPDLILMDIKLRGEMDGIEAARQIHTQSDVPIIYLSAFATSKMLERAKISEPYAYLTKPIDERSLHGAIEVALDKHRMERQLREKEQEIAHRLAQTQTLREIMLAAAATLDFDQVLERTVQMLHTCMDVEFVSFVIPCPDGQELRLHGSQIGFEEPVDAIRIPMDESISGHVYQTGEPTMLSDVRTCPYYFAGAEGIRSEIAIPVRVNEEVRGVLDLESRQLNAFDDALDFYTAIAGQLSITLQNAELYQTAERHALELEQALDQSLELERLKGEFIQNVSHELRLPITLIKGYSTLLANKELGELNAEQERAAAIIARRCDSINDLVGDILLILLNEEITFDRDRVHLPPLVKATVDDFYVQAQQAGLNLQADIHPEVEPVYGITSHLRRVMDNLLSNAVKFTPAGGTVTVNLVQEDGQAVLRVQDTGIGIPASEHQRIFDRFYQIDGSAQRRYGGTGLGLALVKEVVEACGGCVEVESELDCGTTFTICLPTTSGGEALPLAPAPTPGYSA
jgi:signal transduction histidine kinase/AmiR/NasT family two-component response regulator